MEASPYRHVYERGVRVLFDKSTVQAIPAFNRQPPAYPTQDELVDALNRVWLSAGRIAKFVSRLSLLSGLYRIPRFDFAPARDGA